MIAAVIRRAIPRLSALVGAVAAALAKGGRLIYLGAGTSGRLGVLDASECPPTFHCEPEMVVGIIAGGDTALRRSSEGAEDDPRGAAAELRRLRVGRRDVVVGIAAGGTTPYVLGGLASARKRGAVTAMICCIRPRPDWEPADHVIYLPVGPEVLTGSTRMKAGTATKLVLNMISTVAMVQQGKAWGNLMVDVRATNAKLRDRAARIIAGQCGLSRGAALELLGRAQGRVKVALVMAGRGVEPSEAQRLLRLHGGRLRAILGLPRGR
jgi:N-acetylmuramic acid 6-phosphate etherase